MANATVNESSMVPFYDTGALILDCANGRKLAIGRTYLASLTATDAQTYLANKGGNIMAGRKLPRTEGAFRLQPGGELEWIEVDFNGFGELLRYMHGVRVLQPQRSIFE